MNDNATSGATPVKHIDYQQVDLRARITAYMQREEVSQKELADRIGCRPNNFYDYMKRRRGLPYDCVEKVLTLM